MIEWGTLLSEHRKSVINLVYKETLTLLLLIFAGICVLPIAVYLVGSDIFGSYAGSGFGDFYRDIHGDLRRGQTVVIFLLLSPLVVWQLMRLTIHVFRRMVPGPGSRPSGPAPTDS